ncbi:MAG: thermonuclease family protein [candidate division Zixibacteria bacterium]|nr:thermonuclease family protein [candidate division Zixibacteria bacterium]
MRNRFFKSRWIFYLIFVLVVALLVFIFYPRHEGWKVEKVFDGDSVLLESGETVRYIGIDTPEEGESFFWEAVKANQEMVGGGKISLEYDIEKQDKWGRILAYVWVDTLLVNAELIKRGFAWVYTHPLNLKYRNLFCSLQRQARKAKIGIWSVPVSEKEEYYIGNKNSFRFHRPDCKYALQMAERNKIEPMTREAALDSCYSPCRYCKP